MNEIRITEVPTGLTESFRDPARGMHSEFTGWAVVELLGRQQQAGFVTTHYFGSHVMFRVESPEIPEVDIELEEQFYVSGEMLPAGTVVRRKTIPVRLRIVGIDSIFAIIPTTEERARFLAAQVAPWDLEYTPERTNHEPQT